MERAFWGACVLFFVLLWHLCFGKQREHAVKRKSDTHADVGSSSADVSTTWWRCSLPLDSWRPTLHTSRKSNLGGRKREQMIFLYLSPWALLLNKISATTGFLFSLFPFFLYFIQLGNLLTQFGPPLMWNQFLWNTRSTSKPSEAHLINVHRTLGEIRHGRVNLQVRSHRRSNGWGWQQGNSCSVVMELMQTPRWKPWYKKVKVPTRSHSCWLSFWEKYKTAGMKKRLGWPRILEKLSFVSLSRL